MTASEAVVSMGPSTASLSLSTHNHLYRPIALDGRNQVLAAPAEDYILLLQSLDFVLQGNDVVPKCRLNGGLE